MKSFLLHRSFSAEDFVFSETLLRKENFLCGSSWSRYSVPLVLISGIMSKCSRHQCNGGQLGFCWLVLTAQIKTLFCNEKSVTVLGGYLILLGAKTWL